MAGIRVELELDNGQFVSRMLHTGQSLAKFQNSVTGTIVSLQRSDKISRGFLATMRDISVVTATAGLAFGMAQRLVTGWAGQIVQVNAEMERLTVLLANMSRAVDPLRDAAAQVGYLRDFARQAPFSLTALTGAFVKMKATGLDPLNGSLVAFVDGVAAAGGTDEMLNRTAIAISQMSGKGVIQMEELRQQLGEAIPRAIELMARSMGTTYSDLVQQISTGRVIASTALAALSGELNRTFGGAAQSMMNTFTGQMQQTKTLLQNLALKIGETEYFAAVKDQFRDLNAFLSGDTAGRFAQTLGSALASVVNGLRSVLDWFVKFRQEILLTAQVLLAAFAGKMIIGGILSMGTFLAGLGTQVTLLRAQFAGLQVAMTMNNASAAAGSITRLTAAYRGLAMVLPLVGTALSFVGGILVPLAAGIMLAANAFGWFSNKARDAWQNLEQFGATSMSTVNEAAGYLLEQQALVDGILEAISYYENQNALAGPDTPGALNTDALYEDLDAALQELTARQNNFVKWREQAQQSEARLAAQAIMDDYDTRAQLIQSGYDQASSAAATALEEERTAAIEAGRSVDEVMRAAAEATRVRQEEFYAAQLASLASFQEDQQVLLTEGTDDERRAAEVALGMIAEKVLAVQAARDAARALDIGVGLNPLAPDEEAAIERGRDKLADLRRELAGLGAEARGTSSDVAEFLAELEGGTYGPADTEQVIELRDNVVRTIQQIERLKELLKGRDQFADDLEALRRRSVDDLFEARFGDMNDAQKLLINLLSGEYAGMGPGAASFESVIGELTAAIATTGTTATETGEAITDDAFGADSLAAGNALLALTRELNVEWGVFSNLVAGINIPSALTAGTLVLNNSGGPRDISGVDLTGGNAALALLKEFEGFLSSPDWDVNHLRMGYGSDQVTDRDGTVREVMAGMTTTIEDASRDLARRIGLFQRGIIDDIGIERFASLSDQQIAALTSVAYNYGSLPDRILDAVRTGTGAEMGMAVANLRNDNDGVNSGRRLAEAILLGLDPAIANTLGVPRNIQQGPAAAPAPGFTGTLTPDEAARGVGMMSPTQAATFAQIQADIAEMERLTNDNNLQAELDDITASIIAAGHAANEYGTALTAAREKIAAGDFGPDLNPDSDRYAEIISYAMTLDALNEERSRQDDLHRDATAAEASNLERQADAERDLAQATRLLLNPTGVQQSNGFVTLLGDLAEAEAALAAFYGRDSAEFARFLAYKDAAMAQQINIDVLGEAATFIQENERLRQSLLTQDRARQAEHDRDIARMREHLRVFTGTAEERAAIEAAIQDRIRLEREEAWSSGAFANAIEGWTDYGNNIEQAMVGWLDGAADQLATFLVTGEADWAGFFQGIAKEFAKLTIQLMMGNIMKALTGGISAGTGTGLAGRPILSALFGSAHTGGIIGSLSGSRNVNPAVFAGAERFHGGGMIGELAHNEVPIIAQEGEGVFTPAQMKAMGGRGGQSVAVTNNISVSGGGGSAEQNDDLARKIGREVESSMRQTVISEIHTQRRPGGVLHRGG